MTGKGGTQIKHIAVHEVLTDLDQSGMHKAASTISLDVYVGMHILYANLKGTHIYDSPSYGILPTVSMHKH